MSIPHRLVSLRPPVPAPDLAARFRSALTDPALAVPASQTPPTDAGPRLSDERDVQRICHVMSGDLWGGAEMYLVTIASYLIEQPSVRLHVVLFNEGRLARDLRQLGAAVTIVDERRSGPLGLVRALTQFFRDHHIEILHTHKYKDCVLGSIAATLARVPYVVRTVHGVAEPMAGWNRVKERVYYALDATIVRHGGDAQTLRLPASERDLHPQRRRSRTSAGDANARRGQA